LVLFSETGSELVSERREWYALQVWSRKESHVAALLRGIGYECFLPTYKVQRQWSDRLKETECPLFPGYLFSRFDFQSRRGLVMTPGVIQIVGNGRVALPVAETEIERLQMAVASEAPRQPWPYLEVGERVRVTWGSLKGLEGILINFKGSHRVVLSVSLLQRSVAVEIDHSWVTAIEPVKGAAAFTEKAVRVPASSY
jgi:transcription antitermination factor NusG